MMTMRTFFEERSKMARQLLVVVCLLFAATAVSAFPRTQTDQGTAVETALRAAVGASFEPVTGFHPFYVTGDFNGDTVQDLCAVVRVKQGRAGWPKDLRALNPFEANRQVKVPANLANEPTLALIILHSWKTAAPAKFLLIGESPVLILIYDRSTGNPDDGKNLIELRRRQGRRSSGLPRTAKGDVIILGSQVGDSTLYWNGSTYRWEDSPDD
jgi:hypothetical protein